ncbi:hypothetical protein Tco_0952400 [Tanacetum coccineum]|uniref:Uncharacterized protein n=1 Tax=Tanacetum coccineum TaxID=301880 RepID=A0ABQ5DWU9_9ASTR
MAFLHTKPSIVPSLSSSNHLFASPVSDRGNIIRQTASFSLLLGLKDFKMILRVTTAQLQLLEEFMLTEIRSKTYQRRDKDCLENKNTYEDKY